MCSEDRGEGNAKEDTWGQLVKFKYRSHFRMYYLNNIKF